MEKEEESKLYRHLDHAEKTSQHVLTGIGRMLIIFQRISFYITDAQTTKTLSEQNQLNIEQIKKSVRTGKINFIILYILAIMNIAFIVVFIILLIVVS